MDSPSWIAIVAVAVAVGARRRSRRSRSRGWPRCGESQEVLLGGDAKADVVEFAVSLQARIDDLHRAVDEVAAALARVDRRVDGSLRARR